MNISPPILELLAVVAPPPIEGEGQGQGQDFGGLFEEAEEALPEEALPEELEPALIVEAGLAFIADLSPLKQMAEHARLRPGGEALPFRPLQARPTLEPLHAVDGDVAQAGQAQAGQAQAGQAQAGQAQPPPPPLPSTLEAALEQLMNPAPPAAEIIEPAVKVELSTEEEPTATGELVDVASPQVPNAEAPAEPILRLVEAARDTPELSAPLPEVVRIRVDADLEVEVVNQPDGIGVILEGAVEAVDSLKDIGSELRDSLAQGGFDLSSFERRNRKGDRSPLSSHASAKGRDEEPAADAPRARIRRGNLLDRMA